MKPLSVYQDNFTVEMRDVDFTGNLRLSTLFGYFQDVANRHSHNLGIGFDTIMREFGVIWALIRIRVDIIRYPAMNEKILVETWPQKPTNLEFARDFLVYDRDGNIIVRAVSTWAILDIHTRKLKRAKLIAPDYPPFREERALDYKLRRLKPFGQLEMVYKRVIGYSDIDMNEHLNNTKYVDLLMDCFSVESHKANYVKSIEFNYVNEALPGDTIVLYKDLTAAEENMIYIEGINEKNGKLAFQSRLEIAPRPVR
ncbi:MAG: acyl-ACP thioesterase domain-containing protein [Syntrophomonadaceae bacterium]